MRIIVSRGGYGKTGKLVSYIRQNRKSGKTSYLMVPEQFTLQTELFVMEQFQEQALMDIKIMSFERLSREILKKYGGLKRPVIDEIGKHMALRRIFEENNEEVQLYKTAFKKEGFIAELSHTISELKKMAVDGQTLMNQAKEIPDKLFSRKLYEVGLLYNRLEDYMAGHYLDNDDRIGLLAEKISQADYLKEAELFFDSFSGFTVLELNVIRQLCKMQVPLTFTLTYDSTDKTGVFDKTAATFHRLKEICQEANQEFIFEVLDKAQPKSKVLSFLEKSLQDYRVKPQQGIQIKDQVSIYEALSVDEEIEQVVASILTLVQEKDYRYKDILVVTSMPEIYAPRLERIFSKYQLPHFIDIKRDILGSNLIATVFSFLDVFIYRLQYEDVFSFLKGGFTDLSVETVSALENFCLKWGIDGNRWLQDSYFSDEKYFHGIEDIQEIQNGRSYMSKLYSDYRKAFERIRSGKEFSEALFEALIHLNIKQKNDELVNLLREEGEADYANETVQIWNVLLSTMDQLVEIMGDQTMTLQEYKAVLKEGLAQQEVGVIPPTADQIITATMDRSRSAFVRGLFFLGVNESYVPRVLKESPILQEEDKIRLKEIGIDLPSEPFNQNAEDDFAIYSLIAKPTEKLYLSYSLSDQEGKTLRHAQLIDRIRFLLPELTIQGGFQKHRVEDDILSETITFDKLSENLREYVEKGSIDDKWLSVFHWYQSRGTEYENKIKSLQKALFYQNQIPSSENIMADKLYDPVRLSATRIERFAACPFAHFVDYGLRPKERKVYEMDAMELGTSFHTAMEKFAKVMEQENMMIRLSDREECHRMMDAIVDQSLTEGIQILMEGSERNTYMLKKMKKIAKRAAWTMVSHKAKGRFESYGQEVEINTGMIRLRDGREISFRAKVDRVDILQEGSQIYVKVVDYKSGEKSFDLSDAYDGISIQLIFYLNLMMELIEEQKNGTTLPAGAFYFYLADRMIPTDSEDKDLVEAEIEKKLRLEGVILKDSRILKAMDKDMDERMSVVNAKLKAGELSGDSALSEEEFDKIIRHVQDKIQELATFILDGNIAIEPYIKKGISPCQYCEHSSICKFDEKLGNHYRRLRKRSGEEIMKLLQEKEVK